jgi:hypothetical protein
MIHSFSRKPAGCMESPLVRACRLAIPGYHCPQKSLAENRIVIATPLQPTQIRETDTIQYPFYFKRLYLSAREMFVERKPILSSKYKIFLDNGSIDAIVCSSFKCLDQ